MFWSKEYQPSILKEASPKIVGCELTDKELEEFLKDLNFNIVNDSTRWYAFAQYYAYKQGFDIIKATSFAYMVSLFMTGTGISEGTDRYFKEEQIESDLEDKLNQIKSKYDEEGKQIIAMFRNIFWTYKKHISEYEYATERLSFKLTSSEMETFQKINGRNNKEKFKKLLGIGDKMYTISDNIHSKELVKLGFPKNLYTSPESCGILLNHCKKYDMKFLKGSYGTLVHKDFDKYFKVSKSNKIRDLLKCKENDEINLPLDHVNLFKSKIEEDVYILTSSPYASLNMNMFNRIKNYPYSIYTIHPNFLDYIAFVDKGPVGVLRHPLEDINYAFTNASLEQILNINKVIYDGLDLDNFVFKFLSRGDKN